MLSSVFTIQEHILSTQYIREYPGATLSNQEDDLKLHIKQYIPKGRKGNVPGGITIIGTHGNGFVKELYEPLWEQLYRDLKKQGQEIQSIWMADFANQGASGILNERELGNDPSWNDHARDLLHMVNNFRKEMPRPLVGIGHSMGANNLINLSLLHPRLLSALVLIDPTVGKSWAKRNASSKRSSANPNQATRSSTYRRDKWPSRAEAAVALRQSKFYQSWDPRVFDRWIRYGLRDLPTATYPTMTDAEASSKREKPVTLSTSKHQEVFTFWRPNYTSPFSPSGEVTVNRAYAPDLDPTAESIYPFYRPEPNTTLDRLPHLRPPSFCIFGEHSPVCPPENRKAIMERAGTGVGGSGGAAEGKVKGYVLPEGGHLMPMERVDELAETAAGWLVEELERWRKGEEQWAKQWAGKSREEKTMITEEWRFHTGRIPRDDDRSKL